jgi:hypothetical protein
VSMSAVKESGESWVTARLPLVSRAFAVHRQLLVPHRLIFSGAGLPKGAP